MTLQSEVFSDMTLDHPLAEEDKRKLADPKRYANQVCKCVNGGGGNYIPCFKEKLRISLD